MTLRLKPGMKLVVVALAGALFAGPEHSWGQAPNDNNDDNKIEGTWMVTATQKVCESGAPLGLPFQSLLTFARGGTMTGTTASSAFLPGRRSGDFGVWSQKDGHNYSVSEEAFILFSGGPFTQGRQTIRHSISLTRDGFTTSKKPHDWSVARRSSTTVSR